MFIEVDNIISIQDKVKKSLKEYHDSEIWEKDRAKRLQLDLIQKNWIVVYEHESGESEQENGSATKKKGRGDVKLIETSWTFNENMTFATTKDRELGSWDIQEIEESEQHTKYMLNL